jgi:hypothetical protein
MHNLAALLQIWKSFVVVLCVNVKNSSVKEVVFFVENVLFIKILVPSFESINFWIFKVCVLCCLTTRFYLMIQSSDFFLVKIWHIFIIVIVVLILIATLMMDSKSQIISFLLAIKHILILLLFTLHCSNLISFCPISAWNQLGVVMFNARLVRNFAKLFILLTLDKLT